MSVRRLAVMLAAVLAFAASGATATAASTPCPLRVRVNGGTYTARVTHTRYLELSLPASCRFARRIVRGSLAFIVRHGGAGDGDFYIRVLSPLSGAAVRMHCLADGDLHTSYGIHVDCRTGHRYVRRLAFWGSSR